MKVPIFEEIELTEYSPNYLSRKFAQYKMGGNPYYIVIPDAVADKALMTVLISIETALKQLHIHPLLPYPLYIVTGRNVEHQGLAIVKRVEDLPSHFQKRSKRLKPKEQELNNKSKLIIEKIENLPTDERFKMIQQIRRDQREFYRVSKELSFYQEIQTRLQKIDRATGKS